MFLCRILLKENTGFGKFIVASLCYVLSLHFRSLCVLGVVVGGYQLEYNYTLHLDF